MISGTVKLGTGRRRGEVYVRVRYLHPDSSGLGEEVVSAVQRQSRCRSPKASSSQYSRAFDGAANTSDPGSGATATANPALPTSVRYTYDPADRLTAIMTPSGSTTIFTIDALGRHSSQTIGTGPVSTYSYLGNSSIVVQIQSSSATTNSAIDAVGDRVATSSGGSFGYLLGDLHGNGAAAFNAAGTAISDAFAYDAWGVVVASVTSALPTPWRYQGRMLESAAGTPALYDFAARSYNPGLGTFTSLDSHLGSATNTALLNGYLYADANPATLVDPDGHMTQRDDGGSDVATQGACGYDSFATHCGNGNTSTILKPLPRQTDPYVTGGCGSDAYATHCGDGTRTATPFITGGCGSDAYATHCNDGSRVVPAPATQSKASGCSWNPLDTNSCVGQAIGGVGNATRDFAGGFGEGVRNFIPDTWNGLVGQVTNEVNCATFNWSKCDFAEQLLPGSGMGRQVGTDMKTGNWKSLGHTAGNVAVGIAISAGVGFAADTMLPDVGCSFTPDTLVATAAGSTAIAGLRVGDTVMAYDPKTGETGPHTVMAVMANTDPFVEHLRLDSGPVETTPNHPFFTADRGWVVAGSLTIGEQVRTQSGQNATVVGFTTEATPSTMWDITVDGGHTFFVGSGAVLVHNCPWAGAEPPGATAAERAASADLRAGLGEPGDGRPAIGGGRPLSIPAKVGIVIVVGGFLGAQILMGGDTEDPPVLPRPRR